MCVCVGRGGSEQSEPIQSTSSLNNKQIEQQQTFGRVINLEREREGEPSQVHPAGLTMREKQLGHNENLKNIRRADDEGGNNYKINL